MRVSFVGVLLSVSARGVADVSSGRQEHRERSEPDHETLVGQLTSPPIGNA